MEHDTKTPKYQTSDSLSFAYPSVRERWPHIITGTIDDMHRAVSDLPPSSSSAQIAEGKQIISALASLKHELQHNRPLSPLPDDGAPDVKLYNDELSRRGPLRWHDVEWLYSECYMYRRIAGLFALSENGWRDYDVFGRQKISTFKSSRPAVLELADKYRGLVERLEGKSEDGGGEAMAGREAELLLFTEMAEICLWGNATDLSLLTTLSYEEIQKLQGAKARKESEKHVLVNELGDAFDVLERARREKKEERRVDIVLDNAGFELFVDLVLAGYLVAAGLATEVVLHPKCIPWFVSDVVPNDFAQLLQAMQDPKAFYEGEGGDAETGVTPLSDEDVRNVKFLFDHWSGLHQDGKMILRPNWFWTGPGDFWRMPHAAPDLYEDLKESELVLFKGDLNYRKLVGDVSHHTLSPQICVRANWIDRQCGMPTRRSPPRSVLWGRSLGSEPWR